MQLYTAAFYIVMKMQLIGRVVPPLSRGIKSLSKFVPSYRNQLCKMLYAPFSHSSETLQGAKKQTTVKHEILAKI